MFKIGLRKIQDSDYTHTTGAIARDKRTARLELLPVSGCLREELYQANPAGCNTEISYLYTEHSVSCGTFLTDSLS